MPGPGTLRRVTFLLGYLNLSSDPKYFIGFAFLNCIILLVLSKSIDSKVLKVLESGLYVPISGYL